MASPRVLLIAHGFPPASGSGSMRALAFARYLPMYGWRPVVLTPGVEWATNRDDGLLRGLPADLQVLRTGSLEPKAAPARSPVAHGQARKVSVVRRHLGHLRRFPDVHIGWLPHAVAAAQRTQFDAIYSSSGPFTSHVVGLLLKQMTAKPWVAELRDGWYQWNRSIFPDYPAWRGMLEQRLESAVIRSADRVVLVTDRMADAFRAQYADLPREHFSVVSNGFDPVQFAAAPGTPTGFEVLHAGALYYGRGIAELLQAAARLAQQDSAFARAFRLTLLGTLDARARGEVAEHSAGLKIELRGQLDHAGTVAAMRNAAVLLLVANTTPGAEATVPGKLFEYLAVGRPVLAVAPHESSTADVLNMTGGGRVAEAGNVDAIACALREMFNGETAPPDPEQVRRFDRRRLAGQLAQVLDDVRAAHRL